MSKNNRISLAVFCLTLILMSSIGALAQETPINQNFVYIRQRNEDGFQLVNISSTGREVFELSHDDCYGLSPGLNYLAIGQTRDDIVNIYSLSAGEIVNSISLPRLEQRCNLQWENESFLRLSTAESPSLADGYIIDAIAGTIVSESESPGIQTVDRGEVTDLLTDDFRLESPDGSMVVYNRCEGSKYVTSAGGDQVCTADEKLTILNLNSNEFLTNLNDTNQGRFVLTEYSHLSHSFGGISWSPSGQFLAYLTNSTGQGISPIRVYDTFNNRYLNLDIELPELTEFNKLKGFVWIEDEQGLVFWLTDHSTSSLSLMNIDLNSGTVTVFDTPSQPAQSNWTRGIKSETIMYVDEGNNLIEFDLNIGSTTIIDTDVWDIVDNT